MDNNVNERHNHVIQGMQFNRNGHLHDNDISSILFDTLRRRNLLLTMM